jgi:putative inorganic carbon (HCO3(-)) transporter
MRAALSPFSRDCRNVRDLILFAAFLAIIPFIFKRPVVGTLAYALVSLMNPHRLTYGAATFFPFAMYLCIATLLALLISREKKKLPMSPPVIVLMLFFAWYTIGAVLAQDPTAAWFDWDRFSKIVLMIFVTMLTVRTVSDVKLLALTVALSLGFWGVKSGIFVLLSGGGQGLKGPSSSFIGDNNTLALALVTITPLIAYLITQVDSKWLKRGVMGIAGLTALAAIGSYSRGALLGACAMGFFLWLKSSQKFKTGLAIAVLVPIVLLSMPPEWTGRMQTIETYEEDESATGRINSWMFALNVANAFPQGGGPNVFSPHMFMLYAPNPERYYDAHSIYFQVLGELGYFGLALFLTLFAVSWRLGSKIVRFCRGKEELEWASMLARMCQVSMIGYMTAGAFLTLAYYDLIYYVITILVVLDKVLIRYPQPDNTPPMRIGLVERYRERARAKAAATAQRKARSAFPR